MDMAMDGGRTLQTVLVCHPNKVLLNLGRLHAERQGLRVLVAKDGNDVLEKARIHRPDLIVLSNDLKNPTTEETVQRLDADPSLKGIRVVVVKGALPNMGDMLKKFPGVPWQK
jgi:CheY-like chemotaxis protein